MVIVRPFSSLASKAMSPLRKLNGAECLVVGGRRNLPFICFHVEKSLDLCRSHVAQMAHHPTTPMPADKKAHPVRVGFFRLQAVVEMPEALSKLVEEPGGCERRRAGFHG
jgi:hypothetical protein